MPQIIWPNETAITRSVRSQVGFHRNDSIYGAFGRGNMGWAPIIITTIIMTIVGFRVGRDRGRPKLGVTLGFLFGLIGVLAIWLIPRTAQAKQEHLATQAKKRSDEQMALAEPREPRA